MVRQYIGARYVPKFFENPDGTSNWLANTIYEPLTIVTFGNNSYTSKKSVPASVGNPTTSPNYWVATGNFNAQVEELQSDINTINTVTIPGIESDINTINTVTIPGVESDINTINTVTIPGINSAIDSVNQEHILILADSYGTNHGTITSNFLGQLETMLEAQGKTVDTMAQNGASFNRTGYLYETMLDNYNGDNNSVTDIYLFAGANDANYMANGLNNSSIEVGVPNFLTKAKNLFPNAKYHFGFIGRLARPTSTSARQMIYEAIKRIKAAWNSNGGLFLDNCQYILCDHRFMQSDGIHPNNDGSAMLAKYLFDGVMTGDVSVVYWNQYSGSGLSYQEYIDNELYTLILTCSKSFGSSETISHSSPTSVSVVEPMMCYDLLRCAGFTSIADSATNGSSWADLRVSIDDGVIKIAPFSSPISTTSINIEKARVTINTLLIG